MIGKIPKAGRGFKGVVSYLMQGPRQPKRPDATQPDLPNDKERQANARTPERANAKPNRVLWTETHNLITRAPLQAARVMRATASRSRRCKSPVYHFVISWTPEESVSPETMRAIVADTCRDMGLDDHQRIAIAHDDTRHKHVHVVVNRVHHDTGKAWNRAQDWVRLEQSLARQAKDRGLRYVPGRHNAPQDFTRQPKRAKDGEVQRARRKGTSTPAMRWNETRLDAQRQRLANLFDSARSWSELHASLAAEGLSLKGKGQGHVLHDGTSDVKLSRISKTARVALLERRFNESCRYPQETQSPKPPDNRRAIDQKPAPLDAKPDTDEAKAKHPQLKPHQLRVAPPSKVDQAKTGRQHNISSVTQRVSDAPEPPKPKRTKRKGPKL
jgi:hypothetical protein